MIIERSLSSVQMSFVNMDFVNPEIQLSGQNFRERVDLHVILVFNILDSFIQTICLSGHLKKLTIESINENFHKEKCYLL
jgi:hypothetical protein